MNKINLFMIFLIGITGVMVLAGLERLGMDVKIDCLKKLNVYKIGTSV